jgi:hypothetical protein
MSGSVFRFDTFELDRENFQLRSFGQCVRLQKVPLELLLLLADREGQTSDPVREQRGFGGKDVFLDADSAVNTAIRTRSSSLHRIKKIFSEYRDFIERAKSHPPNRRRLFL